jgi:hypothetical protein
MLVTINIQVINKKEKNIKKPLRIEKIIKNQRLSIVFSTSPRSGSQQSGCWP